MQQPELSVAPIISSIIIVVLVIAVVTAVLIVLFVYRSKHAKKYSSPFTGEINAFGWLLTLFTVIVS